MSLWGRHDSPLIKSYGIVDDVEFQYGHGSEVPVIKHGLLETSMFGIFQPPSHRLMHPVISKKKHWKSNDIPILLDIWVNTKSKSLKPTLWHRFCWKSSFWTANSSMSIFLWHRSAPFGLSWPWQHGNLLLSIWGRCRQEPCSLRPKDLRSDVANPCCIFHAYSLVIFPLLGQIRD